MTLRKKAFTLIEMLVVIMIIAILAAALFPAISAAIAQAKSTAMKNRGRGIWTAVLSANAEREPLGMPNIWPSSSYDSSTSYFKYLMGCTLGAGGAAGTTAGNPICEDMKPGTLVGPGMGASVEAGSFSPGNNAWCIASEVSSNTISEDAFIFTRNIDFGTSTKDNKAIVANSDQSKLTTDPTLLGGFNLNRGIYVTYGGACIDRRDKYMGYDANNSLTNNLVSSTNTVQIFRPTP